jgi:dienelactone hydrolase
VGFAAHPSLLSEDEISAITGPASIAAAEFDDLFTAEQRHQAEELLGASSQPFTMDLYGGTSHGFGPRANISNPEEKYGKEQAFVQAVNFFYAWGS